MIPLNTNEIRKNNPFEKNISLTGLYYHFSTYGESIAKPLAVGAIIVGLSTLFWLAQADPSAEPSFSKFVGAYYIGNLGHLGKAFERSLADFLPLLQSPSIIKVGLIDFIVKL